MDELERKTLAALSEAMSDIPDTKKKEEPTHEKRNQERPY